MEALASGYLASAGAFLTQAERKFLAFSASLMTLDIGLRFLTDFLEGDLYFKTHRDGHNLDRAHVQFKMTESFAQNESRMCELVEQHAQAICK